MFWPDVSEYRQFYSSITGQLACRRLRQVVVERWPNTRADTILGLGYPLPYLLGLQERSHQVMAFMPAQQGARHWPPTGQCKTVLTYEDQLPLPDHSVERVLLVHALEHSQFPLPTLEEIWRVLVPGGVVLAAVPNRRGLWAHRDNTPLGHGRPYSKPQLAKLLQQARFTPLADGTLLHFPPTESRLWLRMSGPLDWLGSFLSPMFGGWLWMEAEKQILALTKERAERQRQWLPVGEMATASSMDSVRSDSLKSEY